METLGFNFKSSKEQNSMEIFVNSSTILDLNNDIVNKTIAVRKSRKIKLPDAIIAATALVYSLTIVSRNDSDFKNIQGLNCINPWEL